MNTKWITNKINQHYLIDAEDRYMERCLTGTGYQTRNWRHVQKLVPPGGTAVDVGASIGMNTVNYAGYFDTVHSFEPDPDIYSCLCETVRANHCAQVHTHRVALSHAHTQNCLVKFPRATFANTLKPIGYQGRTRPQIDVITHTLDSYELTGVSLIKIDVEGWELQVLQGAEHTITTQQPVVQVEIKPLMLKRAHSTAEQISAWFHSRNYVQTHWSTPQLEFVVKHNRITAPDEDKNLVDFWFVPKQITTTA